jgi:hypothetical protein
MVYWVRTMFLDQEAKENNQNTTSWFFDRIKTKKGCEGRSCDFTEKVQKSL